MTDSLWTRRNALRYVFGSRPLSAVSSAKCVISSAHRSSRLSQFPCQIVGDSVKRLRNDGPNWTPDASANSIRPESEAAGWMVCGEVTL